MFRKSMNTLFPFVNLLTSLKRQTCSKRNAKQNKMRLTTVRIYIPWPGKGRLFLMLRAPTAVPLTEEEMKLKEELETKGFEHWTRRDFQQFVKGMEKHGR
jgi:hypothetical protein